MSRYGAGRGVANTLNSVARGTQVKATRRIVGSIAIITLLVGCGADRFGAHPAQVAPFVVTPDLAVGYAIRDAQHAKPGEFGCILQGAPTQIDGARMTYREVRQLLGASPIPGSNDDRIVWLILLRGDIAVSSVIPPIPISPQA